MLTIKYNLYLVYFGIILYISVGLSFIGTFSIIFNFYISTIWLLTFSSFYFTEIHLLTNHIIHQGLQLHVQGNNIIFAIIRFYAILFSISIMKFGDGKGVWFPDYLTLRLF